MHRIHDNVRPDLVEIKSIISQTRQMSLLAIKLVRQSLISPLIKPQQMTDVSKHPLGDGAYFSPSNYVGLMARMAILIIDITVLMVLCLGIAFAWESVTEINDDQYLVVVSAVIWLYMAVLKASKFRTVGYWLLGAKIVNLRGQKPSIWRMTFRLLLCFFGPFSLIFDLLWVSTDEQRQTLRDRYAGTCVIKRNAEPIGNAEIKLVSYHAFGFNLMYQQVMPPKA